MMVTRKRRLAALMAVAMLAVGVSACGDDDSSSSSGDGGAPPPGVTDTTVKVGGHFPLTGPAAPGYSQIPKGIEAYFEYVNAQGGVHGRKLEYIARDDGYNPTNTVKVTRQLVLQDKVFALLSGLGTPTHTKVVDFLNASKVPDLFVASGCLCWNEPEEHPWTFGWQTDYLTEGKILGQYVAEKYAGKKIAYFTQNDDFGEDGVKGLDMEIPEDQVIARETYESGNTEIGPQVAKIKAAGADVVVAFTVPAYTALLRLAQVQLNDVTPLVVSNVGSDPTTLGGLLKSFSKGKADTSLIEGMETASYLPALGDTSNPWIELFSKVHEEYLADEPLDGNILYGMATAYTFVTALERAGEDPTRQGIVDAIKEGDLQGPGLVPTRYSADSNAGYSGVQIGVVKDGVIELTGEPLVTDAGEGAIEPYTDEQPPPPSEGVPGT